MQTEKEAYESWRDTYLFGALRVLPKPEFTDEDRARRAWEECRAAVFMPGHEMPKMEVDPERWKIEQLHDQTGIFVRAKVDGKYQAVDIAVLTKASLLAWLKSRGGANQWAESTVAMMLGHGNDPD